jgi:hypothetical protein
MLAGGCVVLLAAAGLGFWRYAATYAPLRPSAFAGPYGPNARHLVDLSTDLGAELYVAGPAGTEAQFLIGIEDDGSHSVTITGAQDDPVIARIQWTPYVFRPGSDVTGEKLPLRDLPAQIGAHQQIRMIITFRKPACSGGGYVDIRGVALNWHALGVDHDYLLPLGGGAGATFVGCPRRPAR